MEPPHAKSFTLLHANALPLLPGRLVGVALPVVVSEDKTCFSVYVHGAFFLRVKYNYSLAVLVLRSAM